MPRAPALLRPAVLTPRGAARDDFDVELTGEMEVNPTLLHVLEQEFGAKFDHDKLLDRIDGVIDTPEELSVAYRGLHRAAKSVKGFQVSPGFVLGTFTYAKLPMVKDLQAAVAALARHDLIAAIAGDPDAQAALREKNEQVKVDESEPDSVAPKDEFLVLDADASQSFAVNAVLKGRDLIVRGPPGTGKSQTIANLIATLISRGKTVLFVAEKRAAIEAVFRRLEQVGLSELVFDLHGGAGKRREVWQNVASTLDLVKQVPEVKTSSALADLAKVRGALAGYTASVHEKRAPWGLSLYDARVALAGLPVDARSEVRFAKKELEQLSAERFVELRGLLRDLIDVGGLSPTVRQSAWAKAPLDTEAQVDAALGLAGGLARQLPHVVERLQAGSGQTNSSAHLTLGEWHQRIALWADAARVRSVLSPALYDADLEGLLRALEPLDRGSLAAWTTRLISGEFRDARRVLRAHLAEVKVSDRVAFHTMKLAALTKAEWGRQQLPGSPAPPTNLARLEGELARMTERVGELGDALADRRLVELPTRELQRGLERLVADRAVALRLPEIRRLTSAIRRLAGGALLDGLAKELSAEDQVVSRLEYAYMASIVEHIEASNPRLSSFDGERHDRAVREYRELDRNHITTTSARLRRMYAESVTGTRDLHPQEAALVTRQAALKRRHQSFRQVFPLAPHVLLALKPCWAMSPLVVSQVLPPDHQYFDVVVFDEASQILPADAVPSIFRGRQLVVAGDEKQLPPTTFFMAATLEDEEVEEAQEPALLSGTSGFESVLGALRPFLGFRSLDWHYRSRDECLIAFSNHAFYDQRLITFPAAAGGVAIEFVQVPFRPGLANQEESVTAEVNEVVARVLAHARIHPHQSLGVIALGIKHANRIEEALRLELRQHPKLDEFFSENRAERFFVKNLERVQGDERDAIILSIGYGKTPDGRLLYRFGPINLEGGERRLNVAITRARERMMVVSSFTWRDMDPTKFNARGAQLLAEYLQYAESHCQGIPKTVRDKPPMNAFEADVFDALTEAGLSLVPQHGTSGYFVDFAVADPKQPGRFILAIECDGASYHSTPTTRDRDRLRQEQLERLGWKFHRIWSTDWFHTRDKAIKRVVAAYRAALDDSGSRTSDAIPEPTAGPQPSRNSPERRERLGPRPAVWAGGPSYFHLSLVDWIESDGFLRTEDELVRELMRELGYQRRGKRIDAELRWVIRTARDGRGKS